MSRPSNEDTAQPLVPPALVRGVRHLLRPLVRLLLSNHVTYPFLSNLLKGVFVEMAEKEFSLEEKRLSDSRLSILTGIHRKDIRRLREESRSEYTPPPSVSLGARLVAQWMGERAFLDEDGRPRALARAPDDTGRPTFEELVASVSTDVRSRAVLDEWVRLGVVELTDDQRVRLRAEAFVPSKGFDEKAHFFGRNLHDHIAAGVHNLEEAGPPMLERSVYYDQLGVASVQELGSLSERLGMDALRKLNQRAMALQERDAVGGDARMRMNFGIYFFRAQMADGLEPQENEDV